MVFYHVAPSSKTEKIESEGLKPTTVAECSCGEGVHVTEQKISAQMWADWLKFERDTYQQKAEQEYQIWKVTDVEESNLVLDEHDAESFAEDSWIICTESNIPPNRIEKGELV